MMIGLFCAYLTRFCTNPLTFSVQVKPSKRTKRSKPVEEPILAEPELRTAGPDASAREQPAVPAPDASAYESPAAPAPDAATDPSIEQVMEGSENP